MSKIRPNIIKTILTMFSVSSIFFVFFTNNVSFGQSREFLEQAFQKSVEQDQVIDIGNSKDAVGNAVFQESVGLEIGKGTVRKQGLLIHITRLIMRVAVVIAIPMLIINAILLIISVATGAFGALLKTTGYIFLGLVIIFSATAIIYMIQSGAGSLLGELKNIGG